MAANIKMTYVCPHCEEGITAHQKPEKCPSCGKKFPPEGANGFIEPVTLCEQLERLKDEASHRNFLVNLPMENANNIMNDALNIIQTIPVKKVAVSDIRNLMGMAIKIGKIAKAYDKFLSAGGTHTFGLDAEGESDELPTTGDAKEATRPEPSPLFLSVEKNK